MGRILFITGAPRCGKTTLTKQIVKVVNRNFVILSLDSFSSVLRREFADFELYSKKLIIQPDINVDKFFSIVKGYIESFIVEYSDQIIVVEGCHFEPGQVKKMFPKSKIICVGRTDNIESIKDAVITKDWMSKLPQADINRYAEEIFKLSVRYKNDCNNADYLYCETEQIILDDVLEYLGIDPTV